MSLRGRVSVVVLAAVTALAGCSSAASEQQQPTPAKSSVRSPPAAFENPVWDSDFPDPMIFRGAGTYWAVGTNGNGKNVQTLSSKDLTHWKQGPDAFPSLPKWTAKGKVWAPEVSMHSSHSYVLYYTSIAPNPTIQCIGVAVSSKPNGPFTDRRSAPLVCEKDRGGSIDAHAFRSADGRRYLYWKNDGNAIGLDTYISVQRLDSTGTRLTGKPTRLFKEDLPWEGRLVEAPFVWEHDGTFHLFYSANAYDSDSYAVGHAVSDSPLGPFIKDKKPVLVSNKVAAGPGHCALFERGGKVWMIYHAWSPDAIGDPSPGRTLWLSEVSFGSGGKVTVVPPTAKYPHRP